MKIFKAIVVIGLVVGLPAGSWLFLQQGLDWRREKRGELEIKMDLIKDLTWSMEEQKDLSAKLTGNTTFLVLGQAYTENDEAIIDQFKDALSFQSYLDDDLNGSLSSHFSGYDYVLLDTSVMVRQSYKGTHDTVYSRIVEDIALLLPKQKELDIKIKKQNHE